MARIAGIETQAFVFEPKDGLRYGHKLWADLASGLLLKAQLLNEHNVPIEQFVFTDIQIGIKIERDTMRPTYRPPPPDWETRLSLPGDVVQQDTGWMVKDLPPGFSKIVEGYRTLRGKVGPADFIPLAEEKGRAGRPPGVFRRPGRGVGVRRADAAGAAADRLVTARRHQRLQPPAGRAPGDGAGRDARRDRAPDRVFRRPSLATLPAGIRLKT